MNPYLAQVCQIIANRGYTAAIVGPNNIQTDAPESICEYAVESLGIVEHGGNRPIVHRRKRAAAKAAAPATRRKRRTRRRTAKTIRTTTRRRHKRGKLAGAAKAAFLARMRRGRKSGTRKTRKTRKTKRRGKKTWTQAARQAFARKMAAARAFYRKAKR